MTLICLEARVSRTTSEYIENNKTNVRTGAQVSKNKYNRKMLTVENFRFYFSNTLYATCIFTLLYGQNYRPN